MRSKSIPASGQIVPILIFLLVPAFGWWKADEAEPGCQPRHCQWGDWMDWELCQARCGHEGIQQRTRVQGVRENCGGEPCRGSHIQNRPCSGDCGPTDKACSDIGGTCYHELTPCDGKIMDGLCPSSPKYVKCCVPQSACTIEEYANISNIVGAGGLPIYVEKDFKPWLDKVNQVAGQCGVQVSVLKSFFRIANPSGQILTPSCESSHPIGHAIDFNLVNDGQTCDATCLLDNYRGDSCGENAFKCFLLGIQDEGLRWGGTWNGTALPDHLDDNFYFRNKCQHKLLWSRSQAACHGLQVPEVNDHDQS